MKDYSKIIELDKPDIKNWFWCKEALAFEVRNGLSKLKHVCTSIKDGKYYRQLLLNDHPIMQGYYPECPTCYGLLKTGYGIENIKCKELEDIRYSLNQNYTNLADAFLSLYPFLKLLSDGHYVLADVELVPTDGACFFYNVSSALTRCDASCDIYFDEYETIGFPAFLYPTQSSNSIDDNRVEYYKQKIKQKEEFRGLAYYEKGFICALLDGHHKAIACAQLGKKLKCLVIIPMIVEEKIMDIQFKNFSLTNQRFKSLNQSILGMYYTSEGIHSIVDEKMIHEDFSLENINQWANCNDESSIRKLEFFLEYKMTVDEKYDFIVEKVIQNNKVSMPSYRKAWEVLLRKQNKHTEELVIQYLIDHSMSDSCWDLVMDYLVDYHKNTE